MRSLSVRSVLTIALCFAASACVTVTQAPPPPCACNAAQQGGPPSQAAPGVPPQGSRTAITYK